MVGSGQGLTRKSYNRVERLATDKRSTLLGLFFSEEFFLNKIGTRNTIGLNKFWPIINGNASNHGWRQKWVIVFAKLLAIILRSFLSGGGGLNFIAISFIFLYREQWSQVLWIHFKGWIHKTFCINSHVFWVLQLQKCDFKDVCQRSCHIGETSGLYYKHILTIVNNACTINVLTIVIEP